jgi:hypothetical protein
MSLIRFRCISLFLRGFEISLALAVGKLSWIGAAVAGAGEPLQLGGRRPG